jgi:serine/threonine protein kinase
LKERKLAELGRRKDIMNEVKLMQQLQHPNVVHCEGWFRDLERDCLFIVLEYCDGGDLSKLIDDYRKEGRYLRESEVWNIFYQICLGLCHLHENGIIHRDIKALNIMINKDHTAFKIGDLGVSRQLSEYTELLQTFYGTPLYLSPELLENKAYNEKTDIWSLGVLLYELCALIPPFQAKSLLGLAKQVLQGEYPELPSRYSARMQRCIRWLLTKDFRKRPHIAQILDFLRDQVGIGLMPGEKKTSKVDKSTGSSNSTSNTGNADNDNIGDEDSIDEDSLDGKCGRANVKSRKKKAESETESEGEVEKKKEKDQEKGSNKVNGSILIAVPTVDDDSQKVSTYITYYIGRVYNVA